MNKNSDFPSRTTFQNFGCLCSVSHKIKALVRPQNDLWLCLSLRGTNCLINKLSRQNFILLTLVSFISSIGDDLQTGKWNFQALYESCSKLPQMLRNYVKLAIYWHPIDLKQFQCLRKNDLNTLMAVGAKCFKFLAVSHKLALVWPLKGIWWWQEGSQTNHKHFYKLFHVFTLLFLKMFGRFAFVYKIWSIFDHRAIYVQHLELQTFWPSKANYG